MGCLTLNLELIIGFPDNFKIILKFLKIFQVISSSSLLSLFVFIIV
jgi:hypothetical protein